MLQAVDNFYFTLLLFGHLWQKKAPPKRHFRSIFLCFFAEIRRLFHSRQQKKALLFRSGRAKKCSVLRLLPQNKRGVFHTETHLLSYRLPPNSFCIYILLFDFASIFFIASLFSGLYQKNIRFCSFFSFGCRATNTFSIVAGL